MWPVMFASLSYDMQNWVMLSVMDASNSTSERRVADSGCLLLLLLLLLLFTAIEFSLGGSSPYTSNK
jgi:hypothetical protein